MKKSLLALGAACIALSGMAVVPNQPLQAQSSARFEKNREIQPNGKLRMATSAPRMHKAPAKVSSADVITSVEGKAQNMTAFGSGYYINIIYLYEYEDQSSASQFVYTDDNEVYIRDILPNSGFGTYVKGVKNGDKIEISLPQTVYFYDDYGYGFKLCMMEKEVEVDEEGYESVGFNITDASSVTLSVAEDGSAVVDGLENGLALSLAYTDDDTWAGCAATKLSFTPFYEKVVEAPEDIEVSENFWIFSEGDYGRFVSWAQGYDEVYFKGICSAMPDSWVKGTMEYDYDNAQAVISIPQNQLVGVAIGQYIYIKCARYIYNEEGYLVDLEIMPDDYKYELVWDFEENTIAAKDPDVSLVFNAALDRIYYLDYYTDLRLTHQDDMSGTPVNPTDLTFLDRYEDYECGMFLFTVPAVSTEGDFLDTNSLYYVVYVDGEEWEFDAEEYMLPESIVEVPWDMSMYYIYNQGGASREIDFLVEGISTLGVQSIYRYEGEETRSEIVTINVDAPDIDDPSAVAAIGEGKKVADVKYYDLSGRQVASPAAGIFVKRVTFEDGSVATFKKAVR